MDSVGTINLLWQKRMISATEPSYRLIIDRPRNQLDIHRNYLGLGTIHRQVSNLSF